MAIADLRKNTLGSNIDKMKGLQLTDLLVPGLFILIFSLLVIFVFIPSIEDTMSMREEMKLVNSKQDDLRQNLDKMKPLIENKAGLYQDLVTTKKIIPKNLDVADFAYFISKTAEEIGLDFQEIQQANSTRLSGASLNDYGDYVGGVSGPIIYKGNYEQIVEFLDVLQERSPYIIEVRSLEMAVVRSSDDLIDDDLDESGQNEWSIEVQVSGYYIPQEIEIETGVIYSDFVPYTRFEDELTIFNYKSKLLSENPDDLRDEEGNYIDEGEQNPEGDNPPEDDGNDQDSDQ